MEKELLTKVLKELKRELHIEEYNLEVELSYDKRQNARSRASAFRQSIRIVESFLQGE